MEKTGWTINDFTKYSVYLYENDELLEKSPLMEQHNEFQAIRLEILRQFAENGSVEELLFLEKYMLERDLNLYARQSASKKEKQSIEAALKQMADAERSLKIASEPAKYRSAAETYPQRQKKDGLPEDGFCQFIGSHRARLSNWLSDRSLESDKRLLGQRRENMAALLAHYAAMQRRALQ